MKVGWEGRGLESAIGKCIATLARPRQPTRRDAIMRARCVAARLIDDSGRNAKSATWRPQIDVRCPIHCSDGTIEREHCGTAFLCARKQVCESGSVRGRCGGADMCHSHVCITGMSLAGGYYIYYVNST